VYLPCHGTENRKNIVEDILYEMSVHISNYNDCTVLLGGDFNCDLDSSDEVALSTILHVIIFCFAMIV